MRLANCSTRHHPARGARDWSVVGTDSSPAETSSSSSQTTWATGILAPLARRTFRTPRLRCYGGRRTEVDQLLCPTCLFTESSSALLHPKAPITTDIISDVGVEFVGPLPAQVQSYITTFSGARRSSSEPGCLFGRYSTTWNMADRSRNSSTIFRPWKRRRRLACLNT